MPTGFVPPPNWVEVASQLRKSGQATLDANGTATISFSTDSGNQRWAVSSVTIGTNQDATAITVPWAVLALNTTDITQLSAANQQGPASFTGNSDAFNGLLDVGPCDFMSVLFYPPPGSNAGQVAFLSGVIASVMVQGTKYTRRA